MMRCAITATVLAVAAAWVPAGRPSPFSRVVSRSVSRAIQILPPTKTMSSEPKVKPVCKINITDSPTMVVSGFVDAEGATDQFIFDVLHEQNVWGRIVALVPDVAAAKKRLLSRTARYTGLLDVLEIEEYDVQATLRDGGSGALATGLKDFGADAWLHFGAKADTLGAALDAASIAGVARVVTLVDAGAPDAAEVVAAAQRAGEGMNRALIVTGALIDGTEGGALATSPLKKAKPGSLANAECVREDAARVAAEAFVLKGAQNFSFTLAKGVERDGKYLKYLRESGADRQEELDALIAGDRSSFVDLENKRKEAKKKKERAIKERENEAFEPFKTCPNGTIVTTAQYEADWILLRKLTDEEMDEAKKAKICSRARQFLEVEFEQMLFGRRDRGYTFEKYVVEHWDRGVYEASVRMNMIPRDEHIEMEKKRWSKWIGKSMRCPPQVKCLFPEVYPSSAWKEYNQVVSEDEVHRSGGTDIED